MKKVFRKMMFVFTVFSVLSQPAFAEFRSGIYEPLNKPWGCAVYAYRSEVYVRYPGMKTPKLLPYIMLEGVSIDGGPCEAKGEKWVFIYRPDMKGRWAYYQCSAENWNACLSTSYLTFHPDGFYSVNSNTTYRLCSGCQSR